MLTARAMEHYILNGIERVRFVVSGSNGMMMEQYLRFDVRQIEVREDYERAIRPDRAGGPP
jgi:hypothetical protein